MKDLTNDAASNLAQLKSALEEVDAFLESAPKGRVNVVEGKKKNFYQYVTQNKDGTFSISYIKDWELVNKLFYKSYCEKAKFRIHKEIKTLETFLLHYKPDAKNDVYSKLPSSRKFAIKPLFETPEYILHEWKSELCNTNTGFLKPSGYITNNNEEVRSKSELIIANELAARKDTLLYHYEPTLYLTASGIDVHPDFSVINIKSGNIYYWEHAGMMDSPDYANGFVDKINKYILSGYLPEKDLIVTCESSVFHLNVSVIHKIMDSLV